MSSSLIRYWFVTDRKHGIGVTAHSIEDAKALIDAEDYLKDLVILQVVENVDIRTLDQGHVTPNMRPPNLRGIWFPIIKTLS